MMHSLVPEQPAGRREFFKKIAAVLSGAAAVAVPIAGSLTVLVSPLLRKSAGGNGLLVRVTSLQAVPGDGVPRKFPVLADHTDAWNKYPQVPVGAVYLRRDGGGTVQALNAVCPHAGGFVDYVGQCNCFICPLHNSRFALDGAIQDPKSPAPRAMDSLPVEIRGDEIWVRFENFRAGIATKIPA
jgi:menaquinol-cytochrome c reductase iron-sulfur subunit